MPKDIVRELRETGDRIEESMPDEQVAEAQARVEQRLRDAAGS
jgi:hypothetical protein